MRKPPMSSCWHASACIAQCGDPGSPHLGAHSGLSRPTVHTATVVHTKQRTATLRDQCVHASSMLNSTPPMGAPNAACTRQSLHIPCQ